MKHSILKIFVGLALLCYGGDMCAQGFLKSLTKKKETKAETEQVSNDSTTVKDKLNAKDIPSYTAQKVYVLDENNQRIKNEDGTDKYIVELTRAS